MADDVRDYESRMRQEAEAERNERKLARGMTGREESARADLHHRQMQEAAEDAMDIRRKRAAAKRK
jgi:hypothetical protein